ncbi:MAG: polysaccharide deacetylase family protein [Alicyclobacillus macrosporangiidus]|uniref:polysaccharide deacetylase family protein n=1 Tax=Alicyclobacillus macrosporangiidus TaxID=392015 RepID=UPI0026F30634|nr:polysaccharide deacetylase family protein [Alicyclobacillus macrosporangiidus]MCL6597868.1 polysaccharide deacetylase family protein [Alicyclobacillus macrosporangiidus]
MSGFHEGYEGPWARQQPIHQHGPESSAERPPRPQHIDWHSRYPDLIILQGPATERAVALTFDDGPDTEWTPQILSILSSEQVKATFCCVGQRVRSNPDVLRRITREGHVVANHSYHHPNLTKLTREQIRTEITSTNQAIAQIIHRTPRFIRPPYGALNRTVIEVVQELNMKILFWNVDSLDWAGLTGPQVAANVLSHVSPGSIILMHSAGGRGESLQDTVDALPYIIHVLRREGYSFRTVSELLGQPAYQ